MPCRHTEEWRYRFTFLTLALDGDELHTPTTLTLGKSSHYPLYRKLGGPQSWSGLVTKRKIPYLYKESNLSCPAHSLVTTMTGLSWLPYTLSLKRYYSVSKSETGYTKS
jgi:hypothetical protein